MMESISLGFLTEWSTLSHFTKLVSFRLNTDEYRQYLEHYIICLSLNYYDIYLRLLRLNTAYTLPIVSVAVRVQFSIRYIPRRNTCMISDAEIVPVQYSTVQVETFSYRLQIAYTYDIYIAFVWYRKNYHTTAWRKQNLKQILRVFLQCDYCQPLDCQHDGPALLPSLGSQLWMAGCFS